MLNRSTQLRHSKVKYKYFFENASSLASPTSWLKLPYVFAEDENGEDEELGIFLDRSGISVSHLQLLIIYCGISLHSLLEIKKKIKKTQKLNLL